VVPYYPLSDDMLRRIIKLQLGHIVRRMKENHKAELTYDEALIATVAGRCKEVESGAPQRRPHPHRHAAAGAGERGAGAAGRGQGGEPGPRGHHAGGEVQLPGAVTLPARRGAVMETNRDSLGEVSRGRPGGAGAHRRHEEAEQHLREAYELATTFSGRGTRGAAPARSAWDIFMCRSTRTRRRSRCYARRW